MLPFLQTIARAYATRYADLSEICFLFPNKRSGTFFLKYLKEEYGRHALLAPEIKTITDFVGDLSGLVVASRIDLLFTLYRCYREYLGLPLNSESGDDGISFDSFAGWGETVISDFNEVDLYLANPEEVFKNVKDYREISSTFLTDEQKKVMLEYFGHADMGDAGRFWKNFDGDEEKLSEVKQKFLHLWRIMAPLYVSFKEKLNEAGLTTVGGMYRRALERLVENGKEMLPYKKVVAIGFNALSTSEHSIFSELRDSEGYEGWDAFADFFWDATGPVLDADVNSASKFVKSNIAAFPCPQWALPALKESHTDMLPESLKVAASPSNSAQTKIAGTMLAELRSRLSGEAFKNAKVAVVLPDENLLLPMLYSLPDGMGDVNLTMGYPMRLTSVVPFVTLLRKLLYNSHLAGTGSSFYAPDLRLFLSHPFSHALFTTSKVNYIIKYIRDRHKIALTLEELTELDQEAATILTGPDKNATPEAAIGFLDSILARVGEKLPDNSENEEGAGFGEGMVKSRLERSHIQVYRDALKRLGDIIGCYGMQMRPATVYRLVDRLLAGEKVGFEGEPLTGLQVMGMLETRSIDFEHIFILSANERILPMRARTRSFIPDSLRHAYGMPPSNYAEGIFAYYFYRMISRAKEVTMIYDARSGGGIKSGDVSRYVLQLRHLFAKDKLKEEDWKFLLSGKEPFDPSIEKLPAIMDKLDRFLTEGSRRNLSASALMAYRECPVRFCYKTVMEIPDDPEPSEFIDAIGAGNILHSVMQQVYLPEDKWGKVLDVPVRIEDNFIDRLLTPGDDGLGKIDRLVTETVNRMHFKMKEDLGRPLTGTARMVADQIIRQVVRILRHDRMLTPFNIYGLEVADTFPVEISEGRKVNFRFAIDRLDEIDTPEGRKLRIVDYKTGSVHLEINGFESIFDGDYNGKQVFQLFTYAWMLGKLRKRKGLKLPFTPDDVRLEIYNVPAIENGKAGVPVIKKEFPVDPETGKKPKAEKVNVESYRDWASLFSEGMEGMLEEIFDSSRPFEACEEDRCVFCVYKSLCRR